MIAEVAVFGFTVKPTTFSYLVPIHLAGLKIGTIAEVPFGKSLRTGVVVALSSKQPDIKLKEIARVRSEIPPVSPQQLQLARQMSDFYFISVAEALHLMLPRLPKYPNKIDQSIKQPIKQQLLLFPTLRQARSALQGQSGTLFSHALPTDQFDQSWEEIRSGRAGTIFGTRSALFAPFYDLSQITIFQPESDLYKDERRPYYRALKVATFLAETWKIKLLPISFGPRVQDEYSSPHMIKKIDRDFSFEVVNLREAEIVSKQLAETLKRNDRKRVLLFLNRKSERGPLACRNCKLRSFVLDPSVCPNCGSADVKFKLFNLAAIQKKINSLLATDAQFATQKIFFEDPSEFDLVVILSADTYLSQANYDSSEKTFQLITQLIRLLKPGGKIVVQTAHVSDRAVTEALNNDYASFYRAELAARKETNYPPFSSLAKITYSHSGAAPELDLPEDSEIFGPFDGKKYPYWIVRGSDLSSLGNLTRPWKIDRDPLRL